MKLRDFIKKLKEFKEIYGDIEVVDDQVSIVDTDKMFFYEEGENPFQNT